MLKDLVTWIESKWVSERERERDIYIYIEIYLDRYR